MNKETLRMQMLAGILTESQYKEKVNELESNTLTADKVEDIAKSSKFDAEMEKVWAKMSDKDKVQLKKGLQSAGMLKETVDEGISFDAVLDKVKSVTDSLSEDQFAVREVPVKEKIGKIIGTIGKINATGLGIPGAIIAGLAGAGSLAMIGTTAVGLLAGAGLWWLGNKLAGQETGDFSEKEAGMTTITP